MRTTHGSSDLPPNHVGWHGWDTSKLATPASIRTSHSETTAAAAGAHGWDRNRTQVYLYLGSETTAAAAAARDPAYESPAAVTDSSRGASSFAAAILAHRQLVQS